MYRSIDEEILVKIANSNVMPKFVWILLLSVFRGSGVVGGTRGKQMIPLTYELRIFN